MSPQVARPTNVWTDPHKSGNRRWGPYKMALEII